MTDTSREQEIRARLVTEFCLRCTARQKNGEHGKPQYGGPCSQRAERCIQCVIAQAVDEISRLTARLAEQEQEIRARLAPDDHQIEELAAAVHEAYLETCARLRWVVKPANAVPYAALPEDAKELDRASVRAVLRPTVSRLTTALAEAEARYTSLRSDWQAVKLALAEQEKATEKARVDGWCDACCGTGKPGDGGACMCSGTGLASMAVTYLRERLIKSEQEIEWLRAENAKLLACSRRDYYGAAVAKVADEVETLLVKDFDARRHKMVAILRNAAAEHSPLADLERQLQEARQEIEAAWFGIEHGYDIESRAELEQQSKTNGFKFGLAQAVHHIWKREPKVEAAERQLTEAQKEIASQQAWINRCTDNTMNTKAMQVQLSAAERQIAALRETTIIELKGRIAAQPHIAPCLRLYDHVASPACMCWMQSALDLLNAELAALRPAAQGEEAES